MIEDSTWLEFLSVQDEAGKGKVMRSLKKLQPGNVVLQEQPVVSASWHKFRCVCCNSVHDVQECEQAKTIFPAMARENLSQYEDELSEIEGIDDIDKARIFIVFLNLLFKRHVASASGGDMNSLETEFKEQYNVLDNIKNFSRVNLPKCTAAVAKAFACARALNIEYCQDEFDTAATRSKLAEVLSLLNTNAHTLEAFSGLGFFKYACRFEHSCVPNCNFSSFFDRDSNTNILTITAIKPISSGENLSLDYIEAFYHPLEERKSILSSSYGFQCSCLACKEMIPDFTRSFVCPKSSKPNGVQELMGIASKRKREVKPGVENVHRICPPSWKCLSCGYELNETEKRKYLETELALEETVPESVEEVEEIISAGIIRLEHYLVFEVLDSIAHEIASEDLSQEEFNESEVELLFQLLIECIELVCENEFCFNKINYYDELAQIYVKKKDISNAQQWFARAFEMSQKCVGPAELCPLTKELLDLSQDTPTDVSRLLTRYNNMKDIEDQLCFQGEEATLEAFKNLSLHQESTQ